MQLASILPINQESVDGTGEVPPADGANVEATIPFASVLSGVLAVLAPEQEQQPVEGNPQPVPDGQEGEAEEEPLGAGPVKASTSTGIAVSEEETLQSVLDQEGTTIRRQSPEVRSDTEEQGTVHTERKAAIAADRIPAKGGESAAGKTSAEGAKENPAHVLSNLDLQEGESAPTEASPKERQQTPPTKTQAPASVTADPGGKGTTEAAASSRSSTGTAKQTVSTEQTVTAPAASRTTPQPEVAVEARAVSLQGATVEAGTTAPQEATTEARPPSSQGATAEARPPSSQGATTEARPPSSQGASPDISSRVVRVEDATTHTRPDEAEGATSSGDRTHTALSQARIKANIKPTTTEPQVPAETPLVSQKGTEGVAPETTVEEGRRVGSDAERGTLDAEPVRQEKNAESTAKAEGKAAGATLEDGDVSADAGGDPDTHSRDTSGRSAQTRADRSRENLETPKQASSFEVDTASEQLAMAEGNKAVSDFGTEGGRIDDAVGAEGDPTGPPSEEHVVIQKTDAASSEVTAGKARTAKGLFQQHRAVPVAWLRAVLSNAQQTVFSEDGWKVLEMNLDEGDGSVTIKARQEEGRMAVAVGFTDPELRAMATAHADRLQEALQAEYEGTVDLSLFSNDADGSGGQHHNEEGRSSVAGTGQANTDTPDDQPGRRPLRAGANHEWVG